jgi:CRP/FNR family cyclic AMP-dependent transcriptional regulator
MQSSAEALIQLVKDPLLRGLASVGSIRRYRSRTLLMQEGDQGSAAFVILCGRVKAFVRGDDDREFVFRVFTRGDLVGELALDGGPRTASVITLEPTVCSEVTLHTLHAQLQAHPQLSTLLLARVIRCARCASSSARGLALHDVYQRVVVLLEQLAETRQGERGIFAKLSQREIAARIGSSREMVSRILRELQRGGYIHLNPGRLLFLRRLPTAW